MQLLNHHVQLAAEEELERQTRQMEVERFRKEQQQAVKDKEEEERRKKEAFTR